MARSLLLAALLAFPAAADAGSYRDDLIAAARARHLADQRLWRLLLHYRPALFGGVTSEAQGKDFFLSPRGRTDPEAELEADLSAFFDEPPVPADSLSQHAQCRFPARYRWLKEQLGFDPARLEDRPCHWFDPWRRTLSASSVSMVFASAYMYNPSSLYGHTFLRLELPGHGEDERLLDYTLNYAAVADDKNGLLFALKGLTGSYPGKYTVMPYYVKVQEYSHLESRDLWEYRLDLSTAQAGRLVDHAWELGSTSFPYYFFNKNCSYQLLPLLEVAAPDEHLTPRHPVWVIPTDTVREVVREGMVARARFRASHLTLMRARRARLTPPEMALATRLVERPVEAGLAQSAALPPQRRALVLDAAEDYLLWKYGFSPSAETAVKARERSLLLARRALEVPADPPQPRDPPPPEAGHDTARVALAGGNQYGRGFQELSLRAALHDLLDPPAGYDPDQEMEMGVLRLRHDSATARTWAQEATIVNILSVSPWDPWVRKPSWEVKWGLDTADTGKAPWASQYLGLRAGSGLAAETGLFRRELWYALLEADSGAGRVFERGYRLGGGARAGLTFEVTGRWRARLDGSFRGYAMGDKQPDGSLALSQEWALSRDLALKLDLQRRRHGTETALSVLVFL